MQFFSENEFSSVPVIGRILCHKTTVSSPKSKCWIFFIPGLTWYDFFSFCPPNHSKDPPQTVAYPLYHPWKEKLGLSSAVVGVKKFPQYSFSLRKKLKALSMPAISGSVLLILDSNFHFACFSPQRLTIDAGQKRLRANSV